MSETLKELASEIKDMGLDHTLNIYQRMLMAQTKIDCVSKNLKVGEGKNQYNAVSERDILDAVKKVEQDCGIYSFPSSRETIELKETTNKYGTAFYWIRINTKYRFVNVDNPEEYIEVDTYGDGVDTMDKAPGKAMTYADKYALMKAYKISTGDDPDENYSEKQNPQSKKVSVAVVVEYTSCRNKLASLGIDVRSESIIQWIAEKTGYADQEVDLSDPVKMNKIVAAYKALIKGKEGKKDA